jgi:hypothetical protein
MGKSDDPLTSKTEPGGAYRVAKKELDINVQVIPSLK